MVHNILAMVRKSPGSSVSGTVNKFGKIAGKLLLLALLISVLWLVRVTVASSQKRIVETFNEDSERLHILFNIHSNLPRENERMQDKTRHSMT
jgi:hypothetical protein